MFIDAIMYGVSETREKALAGLVSESSYKNACNATPHRKHLSSCLLRAPLVPGGFVIALAFMVFTIKLSGRRKMYGWADSESITFIHDAAQPNTLSCKPQLNVEGGHGSHWQVDKARRIHHM